MTTTTEHTQTPEEVFAEYLARERLKTTPQRKTILDVFLDSKGHITSEELYTRVKEVDSSIGQATVYRTLKLLADSGIAKEVNLSDGFVRYEHALGEEHHDHLICVNCKKTVEIVDERIEELQERLAEANGFKLVGHEMYLYGVCDDCRKDKK